MKKRIAVLLLMMVLLMMQVPSALATLSVDSGKCGDDATWSLDTSGTLTICGTKAMYDYDVDNSAPWKSNLDEIRSIVICDGLTHILDSEKFSWGKMFMKTQIFPK